MSSLTLFVGIDVSKDTLDIAVRPTAETWQVANAAAEISTLVAQLEALAPALVVLEATGGFERPLLAALAPKTCVEQNEVEYRLPLIMSMVQSCGATKG